MNKPAVTLAVAILSAVACGATFLFALARQFAMVEIAASIDERALPMQQKMAAAKRPTSVAQQWLP